MQYNEAEWDIGYSRAYIGVSSWEYLETERRMFSRNFC